MPRRPPPSSLRLVSGPLPTRGQAKHTLPSVPRPTLPPPNVSRALSTAKPDSRHDRRKKIAPIADAVAEAAMVLSTCNRAYSGPQTASGVNVKALARRGSCASLGGQSDVSSSSSQRSSFDSGGSIFSSSRPTSPFQSPAEQAKTVVRGPWDHSSAKSLPVDLDTILTLPKPVAVTT